MSRLIQKKKSLSTLKPKEKTHTPQKSLRTSKGSAWPTIINDYVKSVFAGVGGALIVVGYLGHIDVKTCIFGFAAITLISLGLGFLQMRGSQNKSLF